MAPTPKKVTSVNPDPFAALPGGVNDNPTPPTPGLLRAEFEHGYNINQPTKVSGLTSGAPSLINKYAVFRYQSAAGAFNKLYDVSGEAGITEDLSRNPTASKIIEWSIDKIATSDETFGSTPYDWSDFLYCQFLHSSK